MPLAVVLDMDGLMLDTEPLSKRLWQDAARELGYELTDDLFDRMLGRPAAANAQLLVDRFGVACPADRLSATVLARYTAILEAEGVPHKAGLLPLLQFLDAEQLPRAVATSTATTLARYKLDRAGVLAFLPVIVGGDRVARGKPHPDIFLEAAAALGMRADDCIALEDSEPGVLGAVAAGMRVILVPDQQAPTVAARQAAHAVARSLDDARAIIARLVAHG